VNTTQRERLSACIITYNEADRIEACVKSLSFCDDIVVVDSHSTDATREIAASLGVRVIERDWPGYRTQKDFAVRSAQYDWVLCLDADEQVSDELRAEILALRDSGFPHHAGWSVPRLMVYFGQYLKHGTAYPDRLIRLFDRRRGGWIGREIHENTRVSGSVGKLRGHLYHYSYRNLHDQENRLRRYADLMARSLYESGDRGGLWRAFMNTYWRFIRGYFLRLGFLDGWRGLVFALLEANYVRQKYLKLYLLTKGQTV
jgi:glycosyltransferase involved in cell wall biosynthesis